MKHNTNVLIEPSIMSVKRNGDLLKKLKIITVKQLDPQSANIHIHFCLEHILISMHWF